MNRHNLLYGLDPKIDKIEKYCLKFLQNELDFDIAKQKLSITPTFLFYGLPGTGKTTTANKIYKKLKKDFDINLYYLRIDDLISHNFGESSKNLINFFNKIEDELNENDNSYAFVIIDELDSFTVNRFQNDSESIKRILLTFNKIIDEMFMKGIINRTILIATTNMEESIDTSVLRRFFFYENFNMTLTKEEFCEFIEEIKKLSNIFKKIEGEEKQRLYSIYREKKFTLGEIKTIFAHLYMENIVIDECTEINLEIFEQKESFYQLINKQIT